MIVLLTFRRIARVGREHARCPVCRRLETPVAIMGRRESSMRRRRHNDSKGMACEDVSRARLDQAQALPEAVRHLFMFGI
jgi:hypothetical protein